MAAEAIPDKTRVPRVKAIFWLLFACGVVITFWQQFRIAQGDFARETKEAWNQVIMTKLLFRPLPPPDIAYLKSSPVKLQPQIPPPIQIAPGGINIGRDNKGTAIVNNIDTRPHISISDVQQSAITQAMRHFSGRKVFILADGGTQEQVEFGKRMQAALLNGGIQAEFHIGMAFPEGNGVPPWLFIGWGKNNSDMGMALAAVIRDAGIIPIAHMGIHAYTEGEADGFQIIIRQPN